MLRFKSTFLLLMVSIAIGCIRQPDYGDAGHRNSRITPSTENDDNGSYVRSRNNTRQDNLPLSTRVENLANKIERVYKRGKVTEKQLSQLVSLFSDYILEYTVSIQDLSDEQCESIEYDFGRIAGLVYKNSAEPIIDEVEEISQGLEDYERRSKKWEDAAERGFESEAGGDVEYDY